MRVGEEKVERGLWVEREGMVRVDLSGKSVEVEGEVVIEELKEGKVKEG